MRKHLQWRRCKRDSDARFTYALSAKERTPAARSLTAQGDRRRYSRDDRPSAQRGNAIQHLLRAELATYLPQVMGDRMQLHHTLAETTRPLCLRPRNAC